MDRSVITRPADPRRIETREPKLLEIERVDEGIDEANRIALVNPIVEAFRQQRRLPAIRPRNEVRHASPRRFSRRIIARREFSHSQGQNRR